MAPSRVQCCLVVKSCLTVFWRYGWQPTRLLYPWSFPGRNTGVRFPFPPTGVLPDPGIKPTSPALRGRSFTTEPPGKARVQYLSRNGSLKCIWILLTVWLLMRALHPRTLIKADVIEGPDVQPLYKYLVEITMKLLEY